MFTEDKKGTYLPGYTGHVPKNPYEDASGVQEKEPKKQIPGIQLPSHSIKAMAVMSLE